MAMLAVDKRRFLDDKWIDVVRSRAPGTHAALEWTGSVTLSF